MKACDNNSVDVPKCQTATIYICVLFLNHPPQFSPAVMYDLEDQTTFTSLNISAALSDVEDGTPPLNGTHILTDPAHGKAFYNNITGNVTYRPDPAYYGVDLIYVRACDTLNGCTVGNITVVVQNVNRPPSVLNFTHYSNEDNFDLIGLYNYVSDGETPHDNILGTLLFSIVNTTSGAYSSLGTTSKGGALRVYNTHGITTYAPPSGYVGVDTFTFSVCDPCDPTWAAELGRPLSLNCTLQQQRVGPTSRRIACSVAMVTIYVIGVDHLPTLQTLSAIISFGESYTFRPFDGSAVPDLTSPGVHWYRNQSAAIFDRDDLQGYEAKQKKMNLTLFNLHNVSDIDEHSLTLTSLPTYGIAQVTAEGPYGRGTITYKPFSTFSGYEHFSYRVCGLAHGSALAKCSEASVQVFVSKPAPSIIAVTATPGGASDAKISRGDTISVSFDEAINMPPFNTTSYTLNTSEVDMVFDFALPFINTTLVTDAYSGIWLSPVKFLLTINDEGYPQPFSRVSKIETAVGVWTVSVDQSRGPCSRISNQYIDPYCLLTADATSLQANSTSPVLTGSFGKTLPNVSVIVVRNDLVKSAVLLDNPDVHLFQGTRLVLLLQPALSYFQLYQLCNQPTEQVLAFGNGIQLDIEGCSNYLANGTDANELYTYQIGVMTSGSARAGKGTAATLTSRYEEPVMSEMVFRISVLPDPTPSDTSTLSTAVKDGSFIVETLASIVSGTTCVRQESTPLTGLIEVLVEGDDSTTPQIIGVLAGNPRETLLMKKGTQ